MDISVDFDKEKVNVFNIQKFLSFHVFGATTVDEMLAFEAPTAYKSETESDGGKSGRLLDYLSGDNVRVDEASVEAKLVEVEALVMDERVKLAYKCGRDMVICTSKRMLYIDTQGISGKRVGEPIRGKRISKASWINISLTGGIPEHAILMHQGIRGGDCWGFSRSRCRIQNFH